MFENKVYPTTKSKIPLSNSELTIEVNAIGGKFKPEDMPARLVGRICDCANGGEFILLPLNASAVRNGGKRYMKCRKCNAMAHL